MEVRAPRLLRLLVELLVLRRRVQLGRQPIRLRRARHNMSPITRRAAEQERERRFASEFGRAGAPP